MRVPRESVEEKYRSLFPGFKQFRVVEEYEISNYVGWEILKIFLEEVNVPDDDACTIDQYMSTASASDGLYITDDTPRNKQYHKEIRRLYLIGKKEVEIIDSLKTEIKLQEEIINNLCNEREIIKARNIELSDQISGLRENVRTGGQAISDYIKVIDGLRRRIIELEADRPVYGEAEDASPKIRHIDLDD